MRIGIDFDNTIACYDGVFHAAALERGLIPTDLAPRQEQRPRSPQRRWPQGRFHRTARLCLRRAHGPGVALSGLRRIYWRRTRRRPRTLHRQPQDPASDPGAQARHACGRPRLSGRPRSGRRGASQIDPARVFFELTKEEKVARAASLRCEMFIDDLPEILAMPGFPEGMRKILFDPENQFAGSPDGAGKFDRRSSWAAISADMAREQS